MPALIVDTGALLAFFDTSEPDHAAVKEQIEVTNDLLVLSPYVVAELDYLVATQHGMAAELAVLDELTAGAWELARIDLNELKQVPEVIDRYRDQNIGVADASSVVLAERHRTHTILTLDRRHFEVLRPITGDRFTILPDAR